jgi:pimeloyl-ACP methyl ester carboxylesterase
MTATTIAHTPTRPAGAQPGQPAATPTPRQYFVLEGDRIAFFTVGNPANPPLVLVHGWLSHAEVWSQTINAFCDRYYCIAVDLLGLALSDKPDHADYSIPAHAARLLHLLDSLHVEQFTLIGHSLGGQISLYIAAVLAPDRVTHLIDVAGVANGRLNWLVENYIKRRMWLGVYLPFVWDVAEMLVARFPLMARFEFNVWFYDIRKLPLESWRLDREMAINRSMHHSAYAIGQAIRALDLTPYLSGISARTLVIFGTRDEVVPPHHGLIVADEVRGSRLVLFDRCGHFPMYEMPERYLSAVRAFLCESEPQHHQNGHQP